MATEDHSNRPDHPAPLLPEWADPAVPEGRLDAQGVSRRGLLGRAGLFGAGFLGASALGSVVAGATPAAAAESTGRHGDEGPASKYVYLVGDHHVHTVYSHDAKYGFAQSAAQGRQFGLDWIVFTEHANFGHANAGGAQREHEEIVKARKENPRVLIFQGLEWYVPAAEHATVMVAPGANEVELLRRFELTFDAKLNRFDVGAVGAPATAANEAKAVEAIRWLGQRKREGFVDDVLVLANHPSRLGIVSPHELRAWHDADPSIFLGFEGAPGSQGNADPAWVAYREGTSGPGTFQRGEYQNAPSAQSWPHYPIESYRTHGGFDWMTATVGGMWDALLAEGGSGRSPRTRTTTARSSTRTRTASTRRARASTISGPSRCRSTPASRSRAATSGRVSSAGPTSGWSGSATATSCPGCGRGGSGWTTGSCSTAWTCGPSRTTATPSRSPSAAG